MCLCSKIVTQGRIQKFSYSLIEDSMKSFLLVITICFFIVSCSDKEQRCVLEGLPVYPIDFIDRENIEFKSVVDTFFYIPLETSKENLLGKINKVEIDSVIAISDGMKNVLHIYSFNGKMLCMIDKIGNGPGEYLQLSDFDLSGDDQSIDVLDAMQGKVIRYDWNGVFKKDLKLPFPVGVSRFVKYKNLYVFDQQTRRNEGKWKNSVVALSEDGQVVSKLFPYEQFADILMSARNTFFWVGDTLNYLPVYCDTVYALDGYRAKPRFKVDFSDKWVDRSFVYGKIQNPMEFISGLKKSEFVCFLNVLETRTTIWLDFMYGEDKYCCIINKSPVRISAYRNAENAECGNLFGSVLTTWNDYFVMPVEAAFMGAYFGLE